MDIAAGVGIAGIVVCLGCFWLCAKFPRVSVKKSSSNMSLSEMVQDEDPVIFSSNAKSSAVNVGS